MTLQDIVSGAAPVPLLHIGGDVASAGCLVGRTKTRHREFMALVKDDARFQVSRGYRFMAAALPAADV